MIYTIGGRTYRTACHGKLGGLMDRSLEEARMEQQTWTKAAAADRPTSPLDDVIRWLDKDVVLFTQLLDQLDNRLAAVLGEGVPRPGGEPEPPCPGSSPLVTALATTHARLAGELGRLERMLHRVEVG